MEKKKTILLLELPRLARILEVFQYLLLFLILIRVTQGIMASLQRRTIVLPSRGPRSVVHGAAERTTSLSQQRFGTNLRGDGRWRRATTEA